METIVSAVLADLISRSVSFIVNKYYAQQKGVDDDLQHLRRALLRVTATVEEAERRHITNQAMLQQLQMMRKAMYQGCYLFDALRYGMLQHEQAKDQVSSKSTEPFALTKFSTGKRLWSSTRRVNIQGDVIKDVQKMLRRLHSLIDGMPEFAAFLKCYPPIRSEPYSKHLFLEKCMFGRQAEMEKIISFLLQPEPSGAECIQVLPIIGPRRVGKSTLVEHVCYDERVRNHFSAIILYREDPATPEGWLIKKQIHGRNGKSLVILDLSSDMIIDEKQCKDLYTSGSQMSPGSKVIITSRTENILKLGTTGAIKLQFLPPEPFWYFFKVMAFGSTNPEMHPELGLLAIKIAAELDGSFLAAHIITGVLRANPSAQFWRKILKLQRDYVQRNLLLFGERPHTLLQKNKTVYLWSMSNFSVSVKVRYTDKFCNKNEVPKLTLHDVITGGAEDHGKFDVAVWKSCIPPYQSYMMNCEIMAPRQKMSKKKRPHSVV